MLLKGGHLGGAESVDVLATAAGTAVVRRPRVSTTATHGTGCTLSSAIAALAARAGGPPDWPPLIEAFAVATRYELEFRRAAHACEAWAVPI